MTNLPMLGRVTVKKDLKPIEEQKVAVELPALQIGNTSIDVKALVQSLLIVFVATIGITLLLF